MLNFLIILAGVILGRYVIGGLFFAIFGKSMSGPTIEERRTYSWAGRIIGGIIALIIILSI